MALVADHHGPDQLVVVLEDQKTGRVPHQLAVNVPVGVVPAPSQFAEGPKRDESLSIARFVLPKHRSHERCLAGTAAYGKPPAVV